MSLRTAVREAMTHALAQRSYSVGPSASPQEVAGLVQSLRPVLAPRELIRVGPSGDGGYLIPDDLDDIGYCLSPGVSDQSGFERDLADRGITSLLADFSVEAPVIDHPHLIFDKKYVGALTDDMTMTLDDWKRSRLPNETRDLVLQMDIEGAEYETLLNASSELLSQFRIMVVEFHMLDALWSSAFFRVAAATFRRLAQTHRVVHLHPNNCCGAVTRDNLVIPRVMEFTYLRNDRFTSTPAAAQDFPHPLDSDNISGASLSLPACWTSLPE